MFRDVYKRENKEGEIGLLKMLTEETNLRAFKGEVWDTLRNIVTGEEITQYQGSNIIVLDASVLIAALIKRHTGYSGATYWEVGTGLASWDSAIPEPVVNDSALQTPVFRKAIALEDIVFVNNAGETVIDPTNRIQITTTFISSEANYSLREFGIFGGNATSTLGSGLMINHKIHGVITKTNEMELTRVLRLTF